MPIYTFLTNINVSEFVEVEADTKEEARRRLDEYIESYDCFDETGYTYSKDFMSAELIEETDQFSNECGKVRYPKEVEEIE